MTKPEYDDYTRLNKKSYMNSDEASKLKSLTKKLRADSDAQKWMDVDLGLISDSEVKRLTTKFGTPKPKPKTKPKAKAKPVAKSKPRQTFDSPTQVKEQNTNASRELKGQKIDEATDPKIKSRMNKSKNYNMKAAAYQKKLEADATKSLSKLTDPTAIAKQIATNTKIKNDFFSRVTSDLNKMQNGKSVDTNFSGKV